MMSGEVRTDTDYTIEDQQRMTAARRYFDWQYGLAEAELGPRVLEVGCGLGNFTQSLLSHEHVVAIDVEPACVDLLAERFAQQKHLVARHMDVLDPAFGELRRHNIDSVVCLNVLEHISDDLKALRNFHSVLPVGGRAVLIIPAFPALYGPIDANLGHYRRYTKSSLVQLARSAGFEPRRVRYMNFIGFFGWWINARVLKKTKQSAAQIALFDRVVVPVQSALERWIEPPCGQSIFAVLEKTSGAAQGSRLERVGP